MADGTPGTLRRTLHAHGLIDDATRHTRASTDDERVEHAQALRLGVMRVAVFRSLHVHFPEPSVPYYLAYAHVLAIGCRCGAPAHEVLTAYTRARQALEAVHPSAAEALTAIEHTRDEQPGRCWRCEGKRPRHYEHKTEMVCMRCKSELVRVYNQFNAIVETEHRRPKRRDCIVCGAKMQARGGRLTCRDECGSRSREARRGLVEVIYEGRRAVFDDASARRIGAQRLRPVIRRRSSKSAAKETSVGAHEREHQLQQEREREGAKRMNEDTDRDARDDRRWKTLRAENARLLEEETALLRAQTALCKEVDRDFALALSAFEESGCKVAPQEMGTENGWCVTGPKDAYWVRAMRMGTTEEHARVPTEPGHWQQRMCMWRVEAWGRNLHEKWDIGVDAWSSEATPRVTNSTDGDDAGGEDVGSAWEALSELALRIGKALRE